MLLCQCVCVCASISLYLSVQCGHLPTKKNNDKNNNVITWRPIIIIIIIIIMWSPADQAGRGVSAGEGGSSLHVAGAARAHPWTHKRLSSVSNPHCLTWHWLLFYLPKWSVNWSSVNGSRYGVERSGTELAKIFHIRNSWATIATYWYNRAHNVKPALCVQKKKQK